MFRKRLWTSAVLAATMTGCAALGNLTSAQKQALESLAASAGLNLQLTDTAGNQQTLTQSEISSVSFNGKALAANQWAVDASGNLAFKNVVQENSGVVPVVVTLANGQTLDYNYDTSATAIQNDSNVAVFVPGDDGRFDAVAGAQTGANLKAIWEAQHAKMEAAHWLKVDLALKDLSATDPTLLLAVRPGGQAAQVGFVPMAARPFYDVDAQGDLLLDPQLLFLAGAQVPPSNFVPPQGFVPPPMPDSTSTPFCPPDALCVPPDTQSSAAATCPAGEDCTSTTISGSTSTTISGSTSTTISGSTSTTVSGSTSTTVSGSTSTSVMDVAVSGSGSATATFFDSPEPTPPPPPSLTDIQAATFIVVYTSDTATAGASGSVKVVEFQLGGSIQTPNLQDGQLPPQQEFAVSGSETFTIEHSYAFDSIADAAKAEGLLPEPPAPPIGPVIGAEFNTASGASALPQP